MSLLRPIVETGPGLTKGFCMAMKLWATSAQNFGINPIAPLQPSPRTCGHLRAEGPACWLPKLDGGAFAALFGSLLAR